MKNFGIKGKTDREAKVFPSNTITIDFFGIANYRPNPYKMATLTMYFHLVVILLRMRMLALLCCCLALYDQKVFL